MQESFRNEQGNVLYPDVVIHLPGERNIRADSKVSLVAYDRYVSATLQQVQQQALQEHIMSIEKSTWMNWLPNNTTVSRVPWILS